MICLVLAHMLYMYLLRFVLPFFKLIINFRKIPGFFCPSTCNSPLVCMVWIIYFLYQHLQGIFFLNTNYMWSVVLEMLLFGHNTNMDCVSLTKSSFKHAAAYNYYFRLICEVFTFFSYCVILHASRATCTNKILKKIQQRVITDSICNCAISMFLLYFQLEHLSSIRTSLLGFVQLLTRFALCRIQFSPFWQVWTPFDYNDLIPSFSVISCSNCMLQI